MPPYPVPRAIKTKLRCKFSLTGKRYNCRCLGRFMLNGVGYCAAHYDTAWKVANPQYGQQHDWHFKDLTDREDEWETCRRCGRVRPYEGLPVTPCKGYAATLDLSRSLPSIRERR